MRVRTPNALPYTSLSPLFLSPLAAYIFCLPLLKKTFAGTTVDDGDALGRQLVTAGGCVLATADAGLGRDWKRRRAKTLYAERRKGKRRYRRGDCGNVGDKGGRRRHVLLAWRPLNLLTRCIPFNVLFCARCCVSAVFLRYSAGVKGRFLGHQRDTIPGASSTLASFWLSRVPPHGRHEGAEADGTGAARGMGLCPRLLIPTSCPSLYIGRRHCIACETTIYLLSRHGGGGCLCGRSGLYHPSVAVPTFGSATKL